MPKQDADDFNLKHSLRVSIRLLLMGLLLLCIVFFAPHARYHGLKTMFTIASSSRWLILGEFPSAFSSIRIMLLSLGAFLIWASIEEYLITLKREKLAIGFTILVSVPVMVFIVGLYFLFKALL